MGAPIGNEFWKLRSKHGRDKIFKTPKALWREACKYFKWCDDNPLKEEKLFSYQGTITRTTVSKLRPYTLEGLCLFLDVTGSYFRSFKSTATESDNDFLTVIEQIEKTIYLQKFTGAATDQLNANIISRDLGLKDRIDATTDDRPIGGITDEELEARIKELSKDAGHDEAE